MPMPELPPFEPNPVELVLCEHLQLPLDEVAAGSFEVVEETGLVRWNQAVDAKLVQRTVKMDRHTLAALVERAREQARSGST